MVERTFNMPEVKAGMQRDLLLASAFQKPSVILEIPEPSFRPTEEHPTFITLSEIYSRIPREPRRKDPVIN